MAIEFEAPKSIFNTDYSFFYEEYFQPFLEHFSRDISKPIRKSDNEIEYIPTQVFTEFIKTINFRAHYYLPDNNGTERNVFVDGIQFHSSIMNGGLNIVLFKGADISTSDKVNLNDAWLYFKGRKSYQVTEINIKSKTIKGQPNA